MRVSRTITAACLSTGVAASLVVSGSATGAAVPSAAPASVGSASDVGDRTRPTHWVVTIGDSYISGEGGRWAGNSQTGDFERVDALGDNAYFDAKGHERIDGCHRSESAEAYVRAGMRGKNLSCSGATTRTHNKNAEDGDFKPGIDFYSGERGVGQLVQLRQFARDHKVTEVAMSIGGNDFGFASIIATCVIDFNTTATTPTPKYCSEDPAVTKHFTPEAIDRTTTKIENAVRRTGRAMKQAGYKPRQWTLVVQDYPSPLAPGDELRYPETQVARDYGGCPFFDKDATAAQSLLLGNIIKSIDNGVEQAELSNTVRMRLRPLFYGRRLCEKGAHQIQEIDAMQPDADPFTWKDEGAVNKLEWVNRLYLGEEYAPGDPRQTQESIHPNYWGQLAMRRCLRQAVRGPDARGGTCHVVGPGLHHQGEPRVELR